MGKMKFDFDELEVPEVTAVVEGAKALGSITSPIANAVKDTSVAKYTAQKDMYVENQHTIQLKTTVPENIIGDLCGIAQSIANTVSAIATEKEKTKQVQIAARTYVDMEKEQTKQLTVQEKQATKRITAEYRRDVEKAALEMKKRLAELSIDREKILLDERKFNTLVDKIMEEVRKLSDLNNETAKYTGFTEEYFKNQSIITNYMQMLTNAYISTGGSK